MAYKSSWQQPRQDTGWGLIFRLNELMRKIENDVENGNLVKWNLHLDRIYANILYKNQEDIIKDSKGSVIEVKLTADDTKVFALFNNQYQTLQAKKRDARIKENFPELNKVISQIYQLLYKKDVWIRKMMFRNKLYLKEVDADPRKAIYGG